MYSRPQHSNLVLKGHDVTDGCPYLEMMGQLRRGSERRTGPVERCDGVIVFDTIVLLALAVLNAPARSRCSPSPSPSARLHRTVEVTTEGTWR